jgi:hypothetical protein
MCINCALTAMYEDLPRNPHPVEGREYPAGWDLAGFESPDAFGARVGSEADDTARMIYSDRTTALRHMTMAQAFSGHPMELFYDGKFTCFRPAILVDGKAQSPAWHVMEYPEGIEDIPEEVEKAAWNDMVEFLRSQGINPDDILGKIDPDE